MDDDENDHEVWEVVEINFVIDHLVNMEVDVYFDFVNKQVIIIDISYIFNKVVDFYIVVIGEVNGDVNDFIVAEKSIVSNDYEKEN